MIWSWLYFFIQAIAKLANEEYKVSKLIILSHSPNLESHDSLTAFLLGCANDRSGRKTHPFSTTSFSLMHSTGLHLPPNGFLIPSYHPINLTQANVFWLVLILPITNPTIFKLSMCDYPTRMPKNSNSKSLMISLAVIISPQAQRVSVLLESISIVLLTRHPRNPVVTSLFLPSLLFGLGRCCCLGRLSRDWIILWHTASLQGHSINSTHGWGESSKIHATESRSDRNVSFLITLPGSFSPARHSWYLPSFLPSYHSERQWWAMFTYLIVPSILLIHQRTMSASLTSLSKVIPKRGT